MKIHFIVNPQAGRGKGRGVLRKLESILKKERLLYTLHVTAGPTSTIEDARRASRDSDVVVAVGGDGTVNQVANGLRGSEALLGIIPIGSGNDFANMFSLPSHLETAISILKNRKVVAIDLGRVGYKTDRLQTVQERYFVNGLGIGFDAAVAYETTRVGALKGRPLYLFGLLKTLMTYKPSAFKISWENITLNNTHLLVAIGNGVSVGGGFYLTPYAKLDDGKLDVCVVDSASMIRVLRIFPSVLKGKHGKYPEVHFFQTSNVTIESADALCAHADGEILGRDIRQLNIDLLPRALSVISN